MFSMKDGIITIYIIDFLNRGIQDKPREYTVLLLPMTSAHS